MKITIEKNKEGCPFTRVILLKNKLWFKWYHKTGLTVIHFVIKGEIKK